MFQWFADSLVAQMNDEDKISVVMVDAHCIQPLKWQMATLGFVGVPPKPSVWQGMHRLTKDNWFAASNARNTGICYAPDGWIAYVDDLSILGPHWLQSVRESMEGNYIVLGSYEKHTEMKVTAGTLTYSKLYSRDSRLNHVTQDLTSVGGDYLYGCSLAGPVRSFLDVNGWPEALCDGLGSEDYCMGIAIGNLNKYSFRYDRRMATIESEELHHVGEVFKKSDFGVSPNDKSHSALNTAKQSIWFPQYLGEGFDNISQLRQHIFSGGEFPVRLHPDREWFTKQLLSEL